LSICENRGMETVHDFANEALDLQLIEDFLLTVL
jgi:hypothetical protein